MPSLCTARYLHTLRIAVGCLLSSIVLCTIIPSASSGETAEKPPIKTGPNRGQKIPPFRAVDQNGKEQTFESIRGPKGALLMFYRSADW
jgi:hypothetical protein